MSELSLEDAIESGMLLAKCPRSIDFADDIPRSEAGKVQRKAVRAGYWPG